MSVRSIANGANSSSAVVPINSSNFTTVATFAVELQSTVRLVGTVGGGGALTDLLVSVGARENGTLVPLLSGTGGDFATITTTLLEATPTPHLTTAGGSFQIVLNTRGACAAVNIQAKGSNTSLQVDAIGNSN